MPIPTYVPGFPPDASSLGQTKATIRNNLDGTFQTLNVDHVNNNGQPGSNPAGYHTIIHEVPQVSVTSITGYNQILSGVPGALSYTVGVTTTTTPNIPPGGDQQLYSLTGGGILSQLTGHDADTNGYQWVGGVLFQWGLATVAVSTTTPLLFSTDNVAFPTNCFNVQVTGVRNNSGGDGIFVLSGSVSRTGFTFRNGSGSMTQAYWFAIGN